MLTAGDSRAVPFSALHRFDCILLHNIDTGATLLLAILFQRFF
jgi:hypothetical protein